LKIILLIVSYLGLVLGNLFGQQLKFKNNPVDTITFASGQGGMRGGKYTNYVIAYSKKDSTYFVSDYFDFGEKVSGNRKRLNKKKKQHKSFIGKDVDINLIKELLMTLEKLDNKPKFEDLGLTIEAFQKLTDIKTVRRIARKYYADYHFDLKYTTIEKNLEFINALQTKDTFNLYISARFDTLSRNVQTNNFDYSAIRIKSERFKFGISAENSFRQPWSTASRKVVNLKVSALMAQIVPKIFLRKEAFEAQTILNDYIKWFMRKRGIRL
jgi:hypothetical protein